MVVVSYSGKEINAKLVYYGAGLSGKTTNLEAIYEAVPEGSRGKMVSMKTQSDRTLFFDLLPLDLGEIMGFKTRFLLYTVPGQVFYNATRKLVLKGADAIVFVADSGPGKMDENRESLNNLRTNLAEYGQRLDDTPWVLQYNKRDLPNAHTVEELNAALNPDGRVPIFEAVAPHGTGVFETFRGISHLVMQKVTRELHRTPQSGARAARQEEAARAAAAASESPAAPQKAPAGRREASPAADLTPERDPFLATPPGLERTGRQAEARPAPRAPGLSDGAAAGEPSPVFDFTRELPLEKGTRRTNPGARERGGAPAEERLVVESESTVSTRLVKAEQHEEEGAPLSRAAYEERTLTFDADRTAAARPASGAAGDVVVPIRIPAGSKRQIVLRITIDTTE